MHYAEVTKALVQVEFNRPAAAAAGEPDEPVDDDVEDDITDENTDESGEDA